MKLVLVLPPAGYPFRPLPPAEAPPATLTTKLHKRTKTSQTRDLHQVFHRCRPQQHKQKQKLKFNKTFEFKQRAAALLLLLFTQGNKYESATENEEGRIGTVRNRNTRRWRCRRENRHQAFDQTSSGAKRRRDLSLSLSTSHVHLCALTNETRGIARLPLRALDKPQRCYEHARMKRSWSSRCQNHHSSKQLLLYFRSTSNSTLLHKQTNKTKTMRNVQW